MEETCLMQAFPRMCKNMRCSFEAPERPRIGWQVAWDDVDNAKLTLMDDLTEEAHEGDETHEEAHGDVPATEKRSAENDEGERDPEVAALASALANAARLAEEREAARAQRDQHEQQRRRKNAFDVPPGQLPTVGLVVEEIMPEQQLK